MRREATSHKSTELDRFRLQLDECSSGGVEDVFTGNVFAALDTLEENFKENVFESQLEVVGTIELVNLRIQNPLLIPRLPGHVKPVGFPIGKSLGTATAKTVGGQKECTKPSNSGVGLCTRQNLSHLEL